MPKKISVCIDCNVEKVICARQRCGACYMKLRRKEDPVEFRRRGRIQHKRHVVRIKKWQAAYKIKTRQRTIDKKRALRQQVNAIKEATACMDCGNKFPAVCMDFDHRDPATKKNDVSTLIEKLCSWITIQHEISKCDLVCANCHRFRTFHGGAYKVKWSGRTDANS